MRRIIPIVVLAAFLVPSAATALTLRDIIELTRAGLGDEVILALIEVDRPVFSTDVETLKSLKKAGVSERVIIAIVWSGRTSEPPPVAPEPVTYVEPPEPQVIVIDHHDEQPRVREVPVAVPVFIPVVTRLRDRDHDRDRDPDGQHARPDHKRAEPVYWGFGGKLRPDAWKPK